MEVLTLGTFHPAHSHPSFYPTHLLAQQLLFQYSLSLEVCKKLKGYPMKSWANSLELYIVIFRKPDQIMSPCYEDIDI